MFFILTKVLGFFALPSNLLMAIGLVGLALLCTRRFPRLASWLIVTSLVLIALVGYSPLGRVLILPLEDRFPPWTPAQGPPDGIVILGGAIAPGISLARGVVALNGSAERITATAELARLYPNTRIIFSGGTGTLLGGPLEAPLAVKELEALGVAHDRITAEEQSRNTVENAVFSRLIAQPKPGERWLLVTSAFHMPRAIAAFRAAGFPVEAYPVDWRTRGPIDAARLFLSLPSGLSLTDYAVHEWAGLLIYRLTGRTAELFPAP